METQPATRRPASTTSTDKALDVCEVLSRAPRGLSVSDVARTLKLPVSSAHRLLAVLKRRGYVRQDEETARYSLTLKLLDLSFKALGGSELRLHALPLVREYVLRTGHRAFLAIPGTGDVSYLWPAPPDDVAMRTVFGREMPAHCAVYFPPAAQATTRRLSCLKLTTTADLARTADAIARFGPAEATAAPAQRLVCSCAPIRDYTTQEVGRVGVFAHGVDERPLTADGYRAVWSLAGQISVRLGYVPPTALEASA